MGGKTSQSTSQVQIPPEVLARYNSVNASAENVAATPFKQYSTDPSAFVAPLNATQNAGIAGTNAAAGQAQPYFGAATAYTAAGGQAVDPNQLGGQQINQFLSPFLGDVYGATLAGENQQNAQQASGLQGTAIGAGAFGGDRSGVAAANLAYQQNLANSQTNANILNTGFNTALGAAQQQQGVNLGAGQANRASLQQTGQSLAGLGAGAQTAGLQGAQAQLGAGQVEQQTQQAGQSALYNQFLQQQAYPFQTAQFLANIAEGTGALSGSTTTSTQPSSFFSDERLKDDIKPIGKTFDGQPIYSYSYKGDGRTQIGLMAQDVEKHHPDAVGLAGGYKTVDYGKATEHAAHRGHFYRGGLASGGAPTLPGAYAGADLGAILQAQQASQAGVYGASGRGLGGTPGVGGYVPAANGPVGHLTQASPPPQQNSPGLIAGLEAAGNGVESAGKLWDAGKGLGDWIDQKQSASDKAVLDDQFKEGGKGIADAVVPDLGFAYGGEVDSPDETFKPGLGGAVNPVPTKEGIPDDSAAHASLAVAKPPSGGGDSILGDIDKISKLAAMFKNGGRIQRAGGGLAGDGDIYADQPGSAYAGLTAPDDDGFLRRGQGKLSDFIANHPANGSTVVEEGVEPSTGLAPPASALALGAAASAPASNPAIDPLISDSGLKDWLKRTFVPADDRILGNQNARDPGPDAPALPPAGAGDMSAKVAPDVGLGRAVTSRGVLPAAAAAVSAPANGIAAPSSPVPAEATAPAGGLVPATAADLQSATIQRAANLNQQADDTSHGWLYRNKDTIVPILSGLGAMASSNSRYLGSALLQGLAGGAQAAVGVQNQEQDLANKATELQGRTAVEGAQTAEKQQLLAKGNLFVSPGTNIPMVLLANGSPVGSPMAYQTWVSKGRPALFGQNKSTVNPGGAVPGGSSSNVVSLPPAYKAIADANAIRVGTAGAPAGAEKTWMDNPFPEISERAQAATNGQLQTNTMIKALSTLPATEGGPWSQEVIQPALLRANDLLTRLGAPPITDTAGLIGSNELINKINQSVASVNLQAASGRSQQELAGFKQALPSFGNSATGRANMAAFLLTQQQSPKDEAAAGAKFQSYLSDPSNPNALSGDQSAAAGRGFHDAFMAEEQPLLQKEQEALKIMYGAHVNDPAGKPAGSLLQYLLNGGRDPGVLQKVDAIAKGAGVPGGKYLMRYFG